MAEEKKSGQKTTTEKVIKIDPLKFIQSLNRGQLISLGIMLITGLLLLSSIFVFFTREKMVPLFREPLDAKTFIEVRDFLTNRKARFEGERNQKFLVPESQVQDLRVELEALNLSPKGRDGYLFLDETNPLKAGETMMNIQKMRAKEANLARYLKENPLIQDAFVTITAGKDSPFADEKEPSKAAVMLVVKDLERLPKAVISGMQAYIANAIESSDPQRVVITDQYNNLLTAPRTDDPSLALTNRNLEIKAHLERTLQRKILEVVEPILGSGKAVAQVTCDLNFDQVESVQKSYGGPDAEGEPQTLVEQSNEEQSFNPAEVTPAGAGGNTAQGVIPQNASGAGRQTSKTAKTTNYLIDETQRTVVQAPYVLERLSVALNLDYKEVEVVPESPGFLSKMMGNQADLITTEFQAIPAEEQQQIENAVKAAVGFVPDRGDTFSLINTRFKPLISKKAMANMQSGQWMNTLREYTPWVMQIAVFLALIVIASKMFKRFVVPILEQAQLEEPALAPALPGGTPKTVAELEQELNEELAGMSANAEVTKSEIVRKRVMEFVLEDPESTAALLRTWLMEDD
jgi:flagellar M-ring protein FliF